MPEVITNTSPIQYLHQLDQLCLLRRLYDSLVVPSAVAEEIARGRTLGYDLPDLEELPWVTISAGRGTPAAPRSGARRRGASGPRTRPRASAVPGDSRRCAGSQVRCRPRPPIHRHPRSVAQGQAGGPPEIDSAAGRSTRAAGFPTPSCDPRGLSRDRGREWLRAAITGRDELTPHPLSSAVGSTRARTGGAGVARAQSPVSAHGRPSQLMRDRPGSQGCPSPAIPPTP